MAHPRYKTVIVDGYSRRYDAEVKFVEHAARLVKPDTRGRVNIVVEKLPCQSCKNVLQQFAVDHPQLTVRVYASKRSLKEMP